MVCDLMAKHPDKYQPAWFWIIVLRFMYATGARRRQMVALRWRDIDWNHAALTFTVEGSKSRKEWQIPLTPTTMQDLSVLRDRSMDHLRATNRQFQESSLIGAADLLPAAFQSEGTEFPRDGREPSIENDGAPEPGCGF